MARKAKPPPSTLVFSAAEWAPLREAFAHAEGALGSGDLAEGPWLSTSAAGNCRRRRYRGRAFVCVEPTFLEKPAGRGRMTARLATRRVLVSGLPDERTASAAGFFVARAALGKLYSTDPTPSGALPEASDPQRAPRPDLSSCRLAIRSAARSHADASTRGRQRSPKMKASLADDVLVWCEIELGRQPAASAMREAVRKVCSALRKEPPPPKKRSR